MNSSAIALFYTFSTIPQTIAGAMALLAAFVLYRYQTIYSHVNEVATGILARHGLHDRTNAAIDVIKSSFIYYCKMKGGVEANYPHKQLWFDQEIKIIGKIYDYKKSLDGFLKTAFIATVVTILYSVVVLMIGEVVCDLFCLVLIDLVGFSLLLWCLFVYWSLIKAALTDFGEI